ncbi:MAG: tRNA preQ1(34) S-adenosylmethionine ribosyltransferase-isomerase QueA [Peptostreptococcaceae bacterium]|nr:tRNA preQ1(34) S-adenosylmethionine ribosyltransferase-isomerase QueA [Peptostreptococcaceae bacterium]
MHINDFDYELPLDLIAQKPADKRENSRLLVVHRDSGKVEHKHFYNILDYISQGDCLVLNNSKVLPARLFGVKSETGAKVEFLLIKRIEGDRWETMVKPGKRLKTGDRVDFACDFSAFIVGNGEDGTRIVDFEYKGIFLERLEELGSMPLPPYIERASELEDKDRYQTVYCKTEGSVAAPTAGLHFTEELLCKAKEKGIFIAYVTLHVGIGTFRPVSCEKIEEHHMHFEEYEISEESARIINETKREGGRIISVGTTSTRTLESAAIPFENGYTIATKDNMARETDIFIYPGYKFKIIDSLITNFHLPKSTLLMLISALYNREDIMRVYQIAVEEKYRFFSYGDAMLII